MITFLFKALEGLVAQAADQVPTRRLSDAFPDIALTDQFGRRSHFRRHFVDPGGGLIVNTMYTTCRGSCPGTSATIESIRNELSPIFSKRLTFLSFSLEPLIDSPAKLLSYAKVYGASEPMTEKSDWLFLTAAPNDWNQLRRSLGFFELNTRVDNDITQHASTLLVGNLKRDRWSKLPAVLREPVLLDSIRRIVGNSIEEQFGIVD